MNVKRLALRAFRRRKECQNFWILLNDWKERRLLPENELFKVLVHGPPKTWKTAIAERLRLLWPNCVVIEKGGQARMADIAGYPLVIHTHRHVHAHANGLSSNWECVTVDKSRWFALEGGMTEYVGDYGQPETDYAPRFYDLVPMKGPW